MKAIRVYEFGGPEVLRLDEVPTPRPGPSEVVVRMHAAGVNPVETYIRAGKYARLPALPYTPGNDGGGVVEQIGDSVTRFKPGDRVYTAAGDRQRISAGGSGRGASRGHGVGSVWENRAAAKQVRRGRKK